MNFSKVTIALIVGFISVLPGTRGQPGLCINEILASNNEGIQDEDGDFPDWIELFNKGDEPLDLSGYYLSDKNDEPLMWGFPSVVLEPDSFLIVFASGKDRTDAPWLHTNFKISADGEYVLLSDHEGQLVDAYSPIILGSDQSYGRLPDGGATLVVFATPSPASSNTGQPVEPVGEQIDFSVPTGFYTHSLELALQYPDPTVSIHYTLDGSDPGPDAPEYSEVIVIDLNSAPDATLAYIRTNPETLDEFWRWKEPFGPTFTGTVVKARAYKEGVPISRVNAQTYWIHPLGRKRYALPVVSLVISKEDFFGYESGIYVPGITYDKKPLVDTYWGTGNYFNTGIEYERLVNFTYLDTNNTVGVQQALGARISGGSSRALAMKSLRLYARSEYGKSTLDYPFFEALPGVQYKRLLLRNAGQEFGRSHFVDELSHQLIDHLDIEFQHYQPVVVFLNGEYWGIHNMRERIDKHYLAYRRGADPDEIDLINRTEVEEGDRVEYDKLLDYLSTQPLNTPQAYQHIDSLVDLPNFYNYMAIKIYLGAYDWPGNNIRFWRERSEGSKWRWIMFDNDYTMEVPDFNTVLHATATDGADWPNPPWSTFLLRKLLENERIQAEFLATFAFHLEHTFDPVRVQEYLSNIVTPLLPEMQEHILRWNFPKSITQWHETIEEISRFANERPCQVREHLVAYFELDPSDYLFELCDDPEPGGSTNVSPLRLYPNPNSGSFTLELHHGGNTILAEELRVYDAVGQLLYQKPVVLRPGVNTIFVDLGFKPAAGVYLLQSSFGAEPSAVRFIIL